VAQLPVPGQGRLARRFERERHGVPLSTDLLKQVDEVANSLGVVPLSART
jgi:LDH2 family malate/lactate/ureidoglycolate dehydrogenase